MIQILLDVIHKCLIIMYCDWEWVVFVIFFSCLPMVRCIDLSFHYLFNCSLIELLRIYAIFIVYLNICFLSSVSEEVKAVLLCRNILFFIHIMVNIP